MIYPNVTLFLTEIFSQKISYYLNNNPHNRQQEEYPLIWIENRWQHRKRKRSRRARLLLPWLFHFPFLFWSHSVADLLIPPLVKKPAQKNIQKINDIRNNITHIRLLCLIKIPFMFDYSESIERKTHSFLLKHWFYVVVSRCMWY